MEKSIIVVISIIIIFILSMIIIFLGVKIQRMDTYVQDMNENVQKMHALVIESVKLNDDIMYENRNLRMNCRHVLE